MNNNSSDNFHSSRPRNERAPKPLTGLKAEANRGRWTIRHASTIAARNAVLATYNVWVPDSGTLHQPEHTTATLGASAVAMEDAPAETSLGTEQATILDEPDIVENQDDYLEAIRQKVRKQYD